MRAVRLANPKSITISANVKRDGAPMAGAWGSVCGQWVWNNDNAARLVCQQLGFESGEIYTFVK